MISATKSSCPTPLRANHDSMSEEKKSPASLYQSARAAVAFQGNLDFDEITAIAKTDTYIKSMKRASNWRRIGFESQCDGIAIVKNTRTSLPRLSPDCTIWRYTTEDKTQAYFDQLPREELRKGQILARTEKSLAAAPLIALTAELTCFSDLQRIYIPELITAPLTRREFAKLNIQPALNHFRTLFTNHLNKKQTYSLDEVVTGYNNTRPPNTLPLVIEDQVPESTHHQRPAGKPDNYLFCSTAASSSFWWTQANIEIPFKNIKNLQQISDLDASQRNVIKHILSNNLFEQKIAMPLRKNQYTDSWLWHFLYLASSLASTLLPEDTIFSRAQQPKFRRLNLRYSHHQLIMEILDDEGIDLLSGTILNDIVKKHVFISTIRNTVNQFQAPERDKHIRQDSGFNHWLHNYIDDLTNLCMERKKYGRATVYNANTNKPFILVDQQPHYLPFELLELFNLNDSLKDAHYRSVLPVLINDNGEQCTVLEKRYVPQNAASVTDGVHHPFTYKSDWFNNPSKEEQTQLDIYWQ